MGSNEILLHTPPKGTRCHGDLISTVVLAACGVERLDSQLTTEVCVSQRFMDQAQLLPKRPESQDMCYLVEHQVP